MRANSASELQPGRRLLLAVLYSVLLQSIWHVEGGSLSSVLDDENEASSNESAVHVATKRLEIDADSIRQIDDEIRTLASEFNYDSKDDSGEPATGEPDSDDQQAIPAQQSLAARIKTAASNAIQPISFYYGLATRYRKWRSEYLELSKQFGLNDNGEPKLKDVTDFLRLEYAKVDRMLMEDLCRESAAKGGDGSVPANAENVDLVFKILELLIERLEKKLEQIKQNGPESSYDDDGSGADEEILKHIEKGSQEAIDRAKRIAVRSITDKVSYELSQLLRIMLMNSAVNYVKAHGDPAADGLSGLMGRMEPFVILLGQVNTPLIVSYFQSLYFRSIIGAVSRTVTLLKCFVPQKRRLLN
jgi:hypothetical protein